MTYVIELDNGQSFDFSTEEEIMQWMWDNECEFGINAITYGIDEGIAKFGSVDIYGGVGSDPDWIKASIRMV